jgi:hypothetical protein
VNVLAKFPLSDFFFFFISSLVPTFNSESGEITVTHDPADHQYGLLLTLALYQDTLTDFDCKVSIFQTGLCCSY